MGERELLPYDRLVESASDVGQYIEAIRGIVK